MPNDARERGRSGEAGEPNETLPDEATTHEGGRRRSLRPEMLGCWLPAGGRISILPSSASGTGPSAPSSRPGIQSRQRLTAYCAGRSRERMGVVP